MTPHRKVVQGAQLGRFAPSKHDFQSWLLEKQDGRSSLLPARRINFLIFEPSRKAELAWLLLADTPPEWAGANLNYVTVLLWRQSTIFGQIMMSLLHQKFVIPKVLRILHDSTKESCSRCSTWSICTVKTQFPELTIRKTRWPLFPFPCPGNKLFNFRAIPNSRISVITSWRYPTRVCRCKFELRHCFTLAVIDGFLSNYDVTFAPKSCNS